VSEHNRGTNESWWDINQAADYLGVSTAFLRKSIRRKRIPFARVGSKAIRFRRCDLDAWVMASGYTTISEVADEPGVSAGKNGIR